MLKEIGDMWAAGLYRKGQDLKLFKKLNTHWYADSEHIRFLYLINPVALGGGKKKKHCNAYGRTQWL